jgi:hypothetical protein
MLETTIAAVSAEQVRAACGDEPGWFCRNVLDWTENRTLAELADFILGKPITIIAILVIAWLVNRLARRGVKSTLRTLKALYDPDNVFDQNFPIAPARVPSPTAG